MASRNERAQWTEDEGRLARIGEALFAQPTDIEVTLPRVLAEAALHAWHRDDPIGMPKTETASQRTTRQRAGAFALIGAAIERQGGLGSTGDITLMLSAWVIGDALTSADDAGLIR